MITVLFGGSRTRLVASLALLVVAFVAGATLVDIRLSTRALGALAGVASIAAASAQPFGNEWPRPQRWLLFLSLTALAGAAGLMSRIILHAVLSRPS